MERKKEVKKLSLADYKTQTSDARRVNVSVVCIVT